MILYNRRKDGNIEIHSMLLNNDRAIEYRTKEMMKIHPSKQILVASTIDDEVLLYSNDKIMESDINKIVDYGDEGAYYSHWINAYPSDLGIAKKRKEIIKFYCSGELRCYIGDGNQLYKPEVVPIYDRHQGKAYVTRYLAVNKYMLRNEKSTYKEMHNIISVTRALYLLDLLENGKFNKALKEDVNELRETLSLFDVVDTPIDVLEPKQFQEAYGFGSKNVTDNDLNGKIEASQKIYRMANKRK